MKHKRPDSIDPIIPEILKKHKLPIVEPLPITVFRKKPDLVDILPYYILTYGGNIERLGSIISDKKLGIIFIAIGKTIKFLAKRYKHNVRSF